MWYSPITEFRRSILNFFGQRSKSALPETLEQNPNPENIAIAPETPDPIDESIKPRPPAIFFPDKPSLSDYLDFKSYAETLAGLIAPDDTQTPLTVGVFGAWGSGKTTLMGMIEDSLRMIETESGKNKFVFVHFDAWKYYKEDALWRAMLLRVLDALRPSLTDNSKPDLKLTIERLEQSLYRDVQWEEKGGLTIDWPKLVKAGTGGALKLSFSFVPGLSMLVKAVEAAQSSIGGGKIAEDVSAIAEAFQRDLVVHHQSQLRYIEQFQTHFFNLVKTHFKDQRLVIFVDDLDRCLPEKAIEVLEAIKLFLDVEGCVFILGIDQEVITRGLEAKYKEFAANDQASTFSTHYIEKLIQLPFHLPPIEAPEMKDYIDALNVAWPHEKCAQVFAQGLSPNPRQIKRTINVFMLLWKLAERRRKNLGEAVTALRLAKVVILQTAYPAIFDHLKSNAVLLKQLELLSCQAEFTKAQNIDPFLAEAIKQSSLKKLFQLLAEEESASFAPLERDDLMTFFSLARRAPLVTDNLGKEAAIEVLATGPVREESRLPVQEKPFQLRSPLRDFVGRTEHLQQMVGALRNNTSIGVVTGMPGTGKTEFALLVAEYLRADYPDGQLFVDMHGSDETPTDPADALAACIRAFAGWERQLPSDTEELGRIYRSHLNDKRVLVMLDHAASAAQITPLIPPKGSVLLITSRSALVLSGMTSITLDQLSPEEAILLFTSISPSVPTEIVAEICALCGYLPLAVCAAASTLAVTADLDPAVYAKQLSDEQKRIEVLGTEGMNVSLEASFRLSYSRLSEQTASVFRKLSVFPETFDAKAEEIICEDPNHSRLSDLVKWGLVYYEAKEGRYRVHALMRLFAQRQLEETESESVGKNHATYYLEVVKAANARYSQGGDTSIEGLSLFDRERENINAGFKWSANRITSNIEAASICSDYAKSAAQILELRKSPKARIEWFTKALEAARRLENTKAELAHLIDLGAAYSKLGEAARAIDIYTQAQQIARELRLDQTEALILSNLGLKHRDLGRVPEAMEYFKEQLEISRKLNNPPGVAAALVNLATACLATNETDQAIEFYNEALSISRQIADLQTEAMVLGNLGRAYNRHGETTRALELWRSQLEISRKLGDRLSEAAAHFNIGIALQRSGEIEEAFAEANKALQIYQQLESPTTKRVQEWLAKWRPTSEDE